MHHGELLKKLRLSRGVTQRQLATGISSQAAVSRMEDSGNIPTFLLLKFLERLDIYPTEFFVFAGENNILGALSFWDQIDDLAMNPTQIAHLLERERKLYQETGLLKHKINALGYQAIYFKIKGQAGDPKILKELKKYILNFDSWLIHDFMLYTSLLFLFDDELIRCHHQIVLKRLNEFPLGSTLRHRYRMAYTNRTVIQAFERKNLADVDLYLSTYLAEASTLSERVYGKVYTQLLELMRDFKIELYDQLIHYLEMFQEHGLCGEHRKLITFIDGCLN